jgi:membrane protein
LEIVVSASAGIKTRNTYLWTLSMPALLLVGWLALRRNIPSKTSRQAPRDAHGPGGAGRPRMPDNGADTPDDAHALAEVEPGRGRQANVPADIPPAGWKDIVWRTGKEIRDDDVLTVARSIAFSGMLALFPALAAFVSIYGLFADVSTAREHLAALAGLIPADAMTLIGEEMVRIAAQKDASLSFTFLLGLALSVWSANAGMKALFNGLNIAYEEREKRRFVHLNLVTLAFTFGAIAIVTLAIAGVVVIPVLLTALGAGGGAGVLALLRWPVLLGLVSLGLATLYRFGPSRDKPKWRWVSWGSAAATILWLVTSLLFSWYLSNFANYDKTYGSLGAIFGFMMWMWLSAVVILAGAELNAETEHQTAADTTEGAPAPMGARGAEMADTLGQSRPGHH